MAGSKLLAKRAYGISYEQALVVKEYINKILGKGYIRLSILSYAILVLIVKKPDRGIKVYINY